MFQRFDNNNFFMAPDMLVRQPIIKPGAEKTGHTCELNQSAQTNAGEIETYKNDVTSQKNKAFSEMQGLNSSLNNMPAPQAPDKNSEKYKNEDGSFNEEEYNKDLEKYKKNLDNYNDSINKIKEQLDKISKEVEKYDEIISQLESIEGAGVPVELKSKVQQALANNESNKIIESSDITVNNMQVQAYITKFSAEKSNLATQAEGLNAEIQSLSSVGEPDFKNYINSDGTINVDGYKAAVKEYNNAQERILELVQQLESLKERDEWLESILSELSSASSVKEFKDIVLNKPEPRASANTGEKTEVTGKINEKIEKTQKGIESVTTQLGSVTENLNTLNSRISPLIDEFKNAFGKAPKLEDFVEGDAPNIQAYNSAVEKYNQEQEERLKEIEQLLTEIANLESQYEGLTKSLETLKSQLDEAVKERDEQSKAFNNSLKNTEFKSLEELESFVKNSGFAEGIVIDKVSESDGKTTYKVSGTDAGIDTVSVTITNSKKDSDTAALAVNSILKTIKGGTYQALNALKEFAKDGVEVSVSGSGDKYTVNVKYASGNINESIELGMNDNVTSFLKSEGFEVASSKTDSAIQVARTRGYDSTEETVKIEIHSDEYGYDNTVTFDKKVDTNGNVQYHFVDNEGEGNMPQQWFNEIMKEAQKKEDWGFENIEDVLSKHRIPAKNTSEPTSVSSTGNVNTYTYESETSGVGPNPEGAPLTDAEPSPYPTADPKVNAIVANFDPKTGSVTDIENKTWTDGSEEVKFTVKVADDTTTKVSVVVKPDGTIYSYNEDIRVVDNQSGIIKTTEILYNEDKTVDTITIYESTKDNSENSRILSERNVQTGEHTRYVYGNNENWEEPTAKVVVQKNSDGTMTSTTYEDDEITHKQVTDKNGHVTSETIYSSDANSDVVTEFVYNAQGKTETKTTTVINYNSDTANGGVTQTYVSTKEYVSNGNIVKQQYEKDSEGKELLTQEIIRDKKGNEVYRNEYSYDQHGQLTQKTTIETKDGETIVTTTDKDGNESVARYNTQNKIAPAVDPEDATDFGDFSKEENAHTANNDTEMATNDFVEVPDEDETQVDKNAKNNPWTNTKLPVAEWADDTMSTIQNPKAEKSNGNHVVEEQKNSLTDLNDRSNYIPVKDGNGNVTGYSHTYTDSQGRTITDYHNTNYKLTESVIIDKNGKEIKMTYEYTENGYKEIQADEYGNKHIVNYEIDGEEYVRTSHTDEYKDGKSYVYDADGNLINVTKEDTTPASTMSAEDDGHTYYEDDGIPKDTGDAPNENHIQKTQPIKDNNGNQIGAVYFKEDGTSIERVEVTLPDGTKQTTYGNGHREIKRTDERTGIIYTYTFDNDGNEVLLNAINKSGNDVTEQERKNFEKSSKINGVLKDIQNGKYGQGQQWNRNAAISALRDAGADVLSFTKLSVKEVYDLLTNYIKQGTSWEDIYKKLSAAEYTRGGNGSGGNNNYGQPGGQSFGFGDQGFNDVFGNNSYSDGYHLDFRGNWVQNSFGGNYNDGILSFGNNLRGGGGSSGSNY